MNLPLAEYAGAFLAGLILAVIAYSGHEHNYRYRPYWTGNGIEGCHAFVNGFLGAVAGAVLFVCIVIPFLAISEIFLNWGNDQFEKYIPATFLATILYMALFMGLAGKTNSNDVLDVLQIQVSTTHDKNLAMRMAIWSPLAVFTMVFSIFSLMSGPGFWRGLTLASVGSVWTGLGTFYFFFILFFWLRKSGVMCRYRAEERAGLKSISFTPYDEDSMLMHIPLGFFLYMIQRLNDDGRTSIRKLIIGREGVLMPWGGRKESAVRLKVLKDKDDVIKGAFEYFYGALSFHYSWGEAKLRVWSG